MDAEWYKNDQDKLKEDVDFYVQQSARTHTLIRHLIWRLIMMEVMVSSYSYLFRNREKESRAFVRFGFNPYFSAQLGHYFMAN